MKIGDKVLYNQIVYIIEKDYGSNVFLIGNESCFCDMVPAHLLEEVICPATATVLSQVKRRGKVN